MLSCDMIDTQCPSGAVQRQWSRRHWYVVSGPVAYICRKNGGRSVRSSQAPRKISFSFRFWRLSSLALRNLQSYTTTVLNERMWHLFFFISFGGGQNILWPLLHIFKGQNFPTPRIHAHNTICEDCRRRVTCTHILEFVLGHDNFKPSGATKVLNH